MYAVNVRGMFRFAPIKSEKVIAPVGANHSGMTITHQTELILMPETMPEATTTGETTFAITDGKLYLGGSPILTDINTQMICLEDPSGVGLLLGFTAEKPQAHLVFPIGNLLGTRRFTACHRYEPYWMKAAAGTRGSEVPVETQFLLTEQEDGNCVLLVPLLDGDFRMALQGAGEEGLELVAESGDPAVVTAMLVGLFIASGPNPYALVERAALAVMNHLKTGRRRREKELPAFTDQFGWCTWDSFYQEVTHDKVRIGLESFKAGGVQPRLLILDDGWQSVRPMPAGGQRMTAFAANEKFPGGLAPTVQMAKQEFGVQSFIVWHAMTGYWGGVDGDALPGYGVRGLTRSFSPGILHHKPNFNEWWGGIVGLVDPDHIYRFFQDYHRHLRQQGVDGVKVDTQATLEGVAYGSGGRVSVMRRYREALEGSAQTHFRGELINCMSCASEMLYSALNSNITRTSTDFWPNLPDTHGMHLYVNAQVSLWFGEFVHPDWDMFQSGHAMGAFHAAGRAVGGCPIYVSDRPDEHNFDLLRKLVLPDGSTLRALEPGRPTRDCLFHDPTRDDVLLKIFNVNLEAGIVGAFNARYVADSWGMDTGEGNIAHIPGSVSPADVEGLAGEDFAVYAHHAGVLRAMKRHEKWEITLAPLTYEVFTIVPIDEGVASIGLADMFNSAGAIIEKTWTSDGSYEILLRAGGRFVVWSENAPTAVEWNGDAIDFAYGPASHLLEVVLPTGEDGVLTLTP
jgi:raffinose synthase